MYISVLLPLNKMKQERGKITGFDPNKKLLGSTSGKKSVAFCDHTDISWVGYVSNMKITKHKL